MPIKYRVSVISQGPPLVAAVPLILGVGAPGEWESERADTARYWHHGVGTGSGRGAAALAKRQRPFSSRPGHRVASDLRWV